MIELSQHDYVHFNGLLSIEAADEIMRKERKLELALSLLGPTFTKYEMCDSWGIGLLHNHWLLEEDEIPVQYISERNGCKEYITVPRNRNLGGSRCPSVISVSRGDKTIFRPLEFSADPQVLIANEKLAKRPEFLRVFGRQLINSELERTFGLVAFRETAAVGLTLLEFNFSGRVSIVREVDLVSHSEKSTIETAWRFSPNEAVMDCTKSCFQRCSDPGDGSHRNDGHAPVHAPG